MEQEQEVQVTKKGSAGRFLKKSLIWVLVWSAVFFIPPYIFIEKQMSEIREAGDKTVQIFEALKRFNDSEEYKPELAIEDMDALVKDNPEVLDMGFFYVVKLAVLDSETHKDLYQETLESAVNRLSDKPYELYVTIRGVAEGFETISVDGKEVDLKACSDELADRFERLHVDSEYGDSPLATWKLLNEMGFPGWGLETCSQLR